MNEYGKQVEKQMESYMNNLDSIDEEIHDIQNATKGVEVRGALAAGVRKSFDKAEWSESVVGQILDESFDEGALNAEIERKLNELEQQYAPQLTTVRSRVEEITVFATSFGATGDGTTDDYQAIQDAIDYVKSLKSATMPGGRVYLPAGEYRISAPPELYSDIEIYGAGAYVTKIVPDFLGEGVQPDVFRANGTESERLKNISIHDISIDGRNRTEYLGQWGRIEMRYVDNFKAYNVHGHMVGNLFNLNGCEYFEISKISVHDSYCAVHLKSDIAENKYGTISHVIANKSATVIDFGGGSDSIIVSHCIGNQGGFIHDQEEALDIGGARNIKISDSIFSGYRVGAMVKGEAGKEWDNIQFNNVDFYDFWRFGIIAIPGSETACGEIRINNVNLKSEDMELDSNAYGMEIRGNVKKAKLSNVNVDVNAGGLLAYSFDDFQIYGLQIKAGERGHYFAGIGRDNGSWLINGLIVESGLQAIALERSNSENILTNFQIRGCDSVGLTYTNVKHPTARSGVIKNVKNHAISVQFGRERITNVDSINGVLVDFTDVIVQDWGYGGSPNRSGIRFEVPSVTGTFQGLKLQDIVFKITDEGLKNSQVGIDWTAFSNNNIDNSIVDKIMFYNIPNPQAGTSNRGSNIIGETINV